MAVLKREAPPTYTTDPAGTLTSTLFVPRKDSIPLNLNLASPPYERYEVVFNLASSTRYPLPPGTLWVVRVTSLASATADLSTWIPHLRAAFPAVPIVLQMEEPADPVALRLIADALRVRAVLSRDEPLVEAMRQQITAPADLAADVLEWLPLCGVRPPPNISQVIHEVMRSAGSSPSLAAVLAQQGLSPRTVRSWFAACGLPGPGRWYSLARALPAVLRIQREQDAPLLTVAVDAGYSDHASLIRQLRQLFGARPRGIRGTVGWEWLLARFLARTRTGSCAL